MNTTIKLFIRKFKQKKWNIIRIEKNSKVK